jgi:sulfur carrier protein ThiS
MTHRIVVNLQTGEVTQVEYTAEEQAAYDAAIAQQALEAEQAALEAEQEPVAPTEGV